MLPNSFSLGLDVVLYEIRKPKSKAHIRQWKVE